VPVLLENDVHIHYLETSEPPGAARLEELRRMLSPEERGREARLVFERDRLTFLLSHALVRLTLSAYSGSDPCDLEFEVNPFGKPFVRPRRGFTCPCFSLSHTAGLVACAIAWEPEVGIDVEDIRRSNDWELVAHSFSPDEQESLMRIPAGERQARFYELWTLKEAYIKARGMGLSLPLDQFSTRLPEAGPIHIEFSGALVDRPESWQFALFRMEAFRLALAVRTTAGRERAIRMRRISTLAAPPADRDSLPELFN
jgi:4'-phosphopantetheinyl transferase